MVSSQESAGNAGPFRIWRGSGRGFIDIFLPFIEMHFAVRLLRHSFSMENDMESGDPNKMHLELAPHVAAGRNTFLLNVHCPSRQWINILVENESGSILLQKDRKCKAGLNTLPLDLNAFAAGRYKITVLSLEEAVATTVTMN